MQFGVVDCLLVDCILLSELRSGKVYPALAERSVGHDGLIEDRFRVHLLAKHDVIEHFLS